MEENLASDLLFPAREPSGEGILPSQEIFDFISTGKILSAADISDDQVQPASIDLPYRAKHTALAQASYQANQPHCFRRLPPLECSTQRSTYLALLC